jgi:hypothetical protein
MKHAEMKSRFTLISQRNTALDRRQQCGGHSREQPEPVKMDGPEIAAARRRPDPGRASFWTLQTVNAQMRMAPHASHHR